MKKWIEKIALFILLCFLGIILANRDYFGNLTKEITGLNLPCSKPLEYAIGEIDPRFGISKSELEQYAFQAEKIWEEKAGKNLFIYNPDSEFKINLIFDERQRETNKASEMKNELETLGSKHELAVEQYESLSSNYKQKLDEYNAKVKQYEEKLEDYNKAVKKWNLGDRTSKEEFENLRKKRKELEKTLNDLEKKRDEINYLAGKTNQIAKQGNNLANTYNSSLETYQSKFGSSREFEKGVFDGKAINIYEFREESDLKMTIIHEMGHALGLGHVQNPKSIMHYLMAEQDLENPQLTEEDILELKNVCKIK